MQATIAARVHGLMHFEPAHVGSPDALDVTLAHMKQVADSRVAAGRARGVAHESMTGPA